MAIYRRMRTGQGTEIDVSAMEDGINLVGPVLSTSPSTGTRRGGPTPDRQPPGVAGGARGVYPPRGEDHWVAIAVFDDAQWSGLVATLGSPSWTAGPRFATQEAGSATRTPSTDGVGVRRATATATTSWSPQRHGVPAGAVQDAEDLDEHDPQVAERGVFGSTTPSWPEHGRRDTIQFSSLTRQVAIGYPPGRGDAYVFEEIVGVDDDESTSSTQKASSDGGLFMRSPATQAVAGRSLAGARSLALAARPDDQRCSCVPRPRRPCWPLPRWRSVARIGWRQDDRRCSSLSPATQAVLAAPSLALGRSHGWRPDDRVVHCVPRPRRPLLAAPSLALGRSHWRDRPPPARFIAFPGHAGRCWPLPRWRSVARIGGARRPVVHCVPRPRRPLLAAPSLALGRSHWLEPDDPRCSCVPRPRRPLLAAPSLALGRSHWLKVGAEPRCSLRSPATQAVAGRSLAGARSLALAGGRMPACSST